MVKFLSKLTHDDKDGKKSEQKKKRRLQQYSSAWEKDFPELQPAVGNQYKAKCVVCSGKAGEGFSIFHGGITDVRQHFNSVSHKERQKSLLQATLMRSLFRTNSPESEKVKSVFILN